MVVVALLALGLGWLAAALVVGIVIGRSIRMRDRVGGPPPVETRGDDGLRLVV